MAPVKWIDMANLDIETVRHALQVARENGFAEVELTFGEDRFEAKLGKKRSKVASPVKNSQEIVEPISVPLLREIKATVVGYFRSGKVPLAVGCRIGKGDNVGVIAALGLLNDIESPYAGEVVEVMVEVEQAVEYGQVLARVKE
jgi:acetyl-CoA carboxylase biotin carboxyl carrier protein